MLFALFYYIICDTHTFEDRKNLTINMVQNEFKETVTDVIIKNVTIIGLYAFYLWSNNLNIQFQEPITLKSIESLAFYKCENLKSISIPSSVQEIGVTHLNLVQI